MTNDRSEFWDFSLRIYALPGISEECLRLQDQRQVNVNLLLLCAFCGARFGASLSRDDIAEASSLVRPWHKDVTEPLRAARTAMKQLRQTATASTAGEMENIRQEVKRLELAAEKIEHTILEDWWRKKAGTMATSNAADAIRSNIAMLLGPADDAPALVEAASAHVKQR